MFAPPSLIAKRMPIRSFVQSVPMAMVRANRPLDITTRLSLPRLRMVSMSVVCKWSAEAGAASQAVEVVAVVIVAGIVLSDEERHDVSCRHAAVMIDKRTIPALPFLQ